MFLDERDQAQRQRKAVQAGHRACLDRQMLEVEAAKVGLRLGALAINRMQNAPG